MSTKQRFLSLAITVALVALNLMALNYLISGWSTARLDLTEEGLYTISPATERILTSLDEDLTIYGYFSHRTHPKLAPLIPEIVDLLDEYRAVSRGRVHVEILDPGEDEEAEREAADRYGVTSSPFRLASKYESGIVNAYFSLVIRYGDQYERYGFSDLIEVEMTPDGDIDVSLRNLEYDLTRAIKKVVYTFQGTADLFERVDEPVRFTAVMTPDKLPDILAETPEAVRTAAQELQAKGGDRFVYEELDPSTDEALAAQLQQQYGMRPMSMGLFSDESFYLYGLLEVGGRLEQLILTSESITAASVREAIEASLRRNTPGFMTTVGVATSDPPEIPPQVRMQLQMPPQPPPEFEEIKRFLEQDYAVRDVSLDAAGGVPAEVDVLLVLKPQDLAEEAVYNLDQYLMRGGRVIVAGGNYNADFGSQGLSVVPVSSGLDDWLAHFGVEIGKELVLDDRNQSLPLPEVRYTSLGAVRTWTMAPYPYLVQVREDGFADRDITASLDSVGIYWGSPLAVDESATGDDVEVLPILRSSELSWTSDDLGQVAYVDYEVPEEGLEPRLLAVALSGRFDSYFKDRPAPGAESPPAPDVPGDESAPDDEEEPARPVSVPLERSPETRLIVIGNAEFLSDFVARSIGQMEGGFFTENLRFAENLIDWSSLDNDMLEIRARGLVSRRLNRMSEGMEATIEAVSWIIPVGLLAALAVFVFWQRRNAVPLLQAPTSPRGGSTGASTAAKPSRGGA
jgi:ABC-2 type transport system permease protein